MSLVATPGYRGPRPDVVQALRDRVEELEELLGLRQPAPSSAMPHLTPCEFQLLGVLYRGGLITKEFAHRAIWGDKPEGDWPDLKIIDVFICKLRKKFSPLGVVIHTQWGVGYYLTAENKALLKTMWGDIA